VGKTQTLCPAYIVFCRSWSAPQRLANGPLSSAASSRQSPHMWQLWAQTASSGQQSLGAKSRSSSRCACVVVSARFLRARKTLAAWARWCLFVCAGVEECRGTMQLLPLFYLPAVTGIETMSTSYLLHTVRSQAQAGVDAEC